MRRTQWCKLFSLLLLPFVLTHTLSAESAAPLSSPPSYVFEWGGRGQAPGQLFMPWGIAVGPGDLIYVADYQNNRVQVFSPEGQYRRGWGGIGAAPGQMRGPVGIAVGPDGTVYVSDAFNNRVQAFNALGEFLRSWRVSSSGDTLFTPWGIAVDPQGQVYVTDLNAHSVYRFSAAGELITRWGSLGVRDGQFTGPTGIAISSDGRIYVVDSLGYRVQAFTPQGEFLFKWGSLCDLYIHPGLGCSDPDGNGPLEMGDGQLSSPWGIAFDAAGHVYIADSANKRIQVFTSQGEYLLKWGRFGKGPGEFDNPVGVAIDSQGNIYVTDLNNNRVQKFSFPRPAAAADSAPVIVSLEAPERIAPNGLPFPGTVRFRDPDGDLLEARFRVIDGKFDPFTVKLEEHVGRTEGSFRFSVSCMISQQVILKLVLIDQAGNRSDPQSFSFTCGDPPPGNYDEEQSTIRPTRYVLGVNLFILEDGVTPLADGAIYPQEEALVGPPRLEVRQAILQQIIPAVTGIWDQCGVEYVLQNMAVVRPQKVQLSAGNLDRLLFVRTGELPEIAIADSNRRRPIDLLTEALGPVGRALEAQGTRLDPRSLSVYVTGARLVLQAGEVRNFGGVTTINGRVSLIRWDDIFVVSRETGEILPPKRPITAIAHEFGHNFGLQHSDQQGILQVAQDPLNLMLSNTQQPTAVPPQPTVNLMASQCALAEPIITQLHVGRP
jgi:DNA-binding beta-propeller fold protein YncE